MGWQERLLHGIWDTCTVLFFSYIQSFSSLIFFLSVAYVNPLPNTDLDADLIIVLDHAI